MCLALIFSPDSLDSLVTVTILHNQVIIGSPGILVLPQFDSKNVALTTFLCYLELKVSSSVEELHNPVTDTAVCWLSNNAVWL